MYYRILTEDKNRDEIEELIAQRFDSFTILEGVGYWQGKREKCLVIEIQIPYVSNSAKLTDCERIHALAHAIKRANNQKAIIVQEIASREDLLT